MATDGTGASQDSDADERAEQEHLAAEELMGAREFGRLDAVFPVEGVDDMGTMTDTRVYEGELEARTPGSDQPDEPREANLEFLESLELRADETDDPAEAAEEGMTWVPPTDPPIIGTSGTDLEIGAGFGGTSIAEPFDADHHGEAMWADDEVTERVREALRADALASRYADDLHIDTDGEVVRISGIVDDLEDEEQVLAVIAEVEGLTTIRNRIRVLALE